MAKGKYKQLDPHDLGAVAKIICKWPKLCVSAERFELVVAYMDGYADALRFLFPERYNVEDGPGPGFNLFVCKKFHDSTSYHWSTVFRKVYPDEAEAFEELPKLYDEYMRSLRYEAPEKDSAT